MEKPADSRKDEGSEEVEVIDDGYTGDMDEAPALEVERGSEKELEVIDKLE